MRTWGTVGCTSALWGSRPWFYTTWGLGKSALATGGKEMNWFCVVYWSLLAKYPTHMTSVQLLSRVGLFATPWTGACQTSLSITNSQSLLKLMSIESVMPSNHLILCHPLLLLPSIFPSIRVFSNESVLRIRWPRNEEARTTRIDYFAQDPKLSQQKECI